MLNRHKTVAMIWLLALCPIAMSQEIMDVDAALSVFEGTVHEIRSFDLSVESTMRFMIHKSRKVQPGQEQYARREFSRQVYEKGVGRIEILDGPTGKPVKIMGYTPETLRTYDPRSGEALISRPTGSNTMVGGDYRETFRSVFGGIVIGDLVTAFRQRKGQVGVKAPTNNSPFLNLLAKPVRLSNLQSVDWGAWSIEIGLDPRRGMKPALIQVFQPVDNELRLYRRTIVQDWKDIGSGVWVPIKAKTEVFYLDITNKELDGTVANEIVLSVDVSRSSWNKGTKEDVLRLPLPAGTKVMDLERRVRFITGEEDAGKNLSDLAAQARNVRQIETVMPRKQQSMTRLWQYWGLALLALILVTTSMVVWRLRQHRIS